MSKFFDEFLDLDSYLSKSGTWPTLKGVFDNLRCYPMLALILFALKVLASSGKLMEQIAYWFLAPLFALLAVATLAQSAFILSLVIVGWSSFFFGKALPPNTGSEQRKSSRLLVGAILSILIFVAFVSASSLLSVLSNLRVNG